MRDTRSALSGESSVAHQSGTAGGPASRTALAIVVPHTHWDREWYAPFETLRFQLVRFLDELVDALEHDPGLPSFLLDGQAVILEDYLEIRPERRSRIEALVGAGRLRPGPFYVQADEFCVSGEALVRNLLAGFQAAARFGPVLREGYLPDVFGHVHQLPQILRGFGIETFYAMRGLGGDVDATGSEFWWEAPDGSRVLVHWLVESYSNAAVLRPDAASTALHHDPVVSYDSLFDLLDRLSARSVCGVLLLLNGGDHLRLQPDLPGLVAALDRQVPIRLRLGGLEDFHRLAAEAQAPRTVHRGELRQGRYHHVCEGVISTRVDLKRHSERVEQRLSGVAERLDAVAGLVDGVSNAAHLRYAWRELLKNYPHDSITGCSVDEVHDEMRTRFAKVGQVADAVARDALGRLAQAVAPAARGGEVPVVVVNPSPWARTGPVEAHVAPDLSPPLGERRFGWQPAGTVDWSTYALLDPDGHALPFTVGGSVTSVEDILNRRKELVRDRILFTAHQVPPLGTATFRLVPAARLEGPGYGHAPSVTRSPSTLDNEHLRVTARTDGTFTVHDKESGAAYQGLGELLDDADAGDEYTFSGLPGDRPVTCRTWRVAPGDGDDSLRLDGVLRLPAALAADGTSRAEQRVDCPVTVTLRLPATSRSVLVTVAIDNQARDHRLRVRFPTGLRAGHSLAESAFGVVARPQAPPEAAGWRERPAGTQPLRRFVALEDGGAGLAVLTRGLHEYTHEESGALTLTLLRGVGWLSREALPGRPHPLGPRLPTPGAQCLGPHTFEFAVRPYTGGWQDAGLFRSAEELALPLLAQTVQPTTTAGRPPLAHGSFLSVEPASVVLSALKAAEDGRGLVIRVFNAGDAPTTGRLRLGVRLAGAARTTLDEEDLEELTPADAHSLELRLGPAEIATVRIVPAAPPTARPGARNKE